MPNVAILAGLTKTSRKMMTTMMVVVAAMRTTIVSPAGLGVTMGDDNTVRYVRY